MAHAMTRLQHVLYNAVCARFAADPSVFQLNQPAGPIPLTDEALWAHEDLVPPAALTFNTGLRQASRFSAEYRALVSAPDAPAEYQGGVDGLVATLALSPGVVFEFDSATTSADVTHAWAEDAGPAIFGLWQGLDSAHPVSARFAASTVAVAGGCEAYAVWTAVPGPWYDSATLNRYFSTPTTPRWEDFFGVDGRLLRAVGALFVLDGVRLTVVSDARFSPAEQALVREHVADGVWPLFAADDGSTTNAVTFAEEGMTLSTTVPAGNPVVLGRTVLDIARYLGHQPTAEQRAQLQER